MHKQTKTILAKAQETYCRTIEYDCEIDIPLAFFESADKEALNDFICEAIDEPKRVNFVDIIESEQLNKEIIEINEGKLPDKVINNYTIVLYSKE